MSLSLDTILTWYIKLRWSKVRETILFIGASGWSLTQRNYKYNNGELDPINRSKLVGVLLPCILPSIVPTHALGKKPVAQW